jgi:apolipoprotein N-acyltransferase
VRDYQIYKERNQPTSIGMRLEFWQKSLRFWPWLAAIVSGILCTACFPPFNHTWLCWIALTPLIAAVWFSGKNSKRRWLRDLLLGYVAGVIFFSVAFSWLSALGILFENFWLHGLSLLLSIYLGLNFAFWSWFCGLLRPPVVATVSAGDATARPVANKWSAMLERAGRPAPVPKTPWLRSTSNLRLAFLLASAWVAHEWIRGWLFTGFGERFPGRYPQVRTPKLCCLSTNEQQTRKSAKLPGA